MRNYRGFAIIVGIVVLIVVVPSLLLNHYEETARAAQPCVIADLGAGVYKFSCWDGEFPRVYAKWRKDNNIQSASVVKHFADFIVSVPWK